MTQLSLYSQIDTMTTVITIVKSTSSPTVTPVAIIYRRAAIDSVSV